MVTKIKNLLTDLHNLKDGQENFFLSVMCDELKLVGTSQYVGVPKSISVTISRGTKTYAKTYGNHLSTSIRDACKSALVNLLQEEIVATCSHWDLRIYVPSGFEGAKLFTAILSQVPGFSLLDVDDPDAKREIIVC